MAATHCKNNHADTAQKVQLKFSSNIKMKKVRFMWLNCCVVLDTVCRVYIEYSYKQNQIDVERICMQPETPYGWARSENTTILVWADTKSLVTRIITLYNRGKQKSMSEWTTPKTLRLMSCNRGRLQVPLLSFENRNRRLSWAQTPQNWTDKNCFYQVFFLKSYVLLWLLLLTRCFHPSNCRTL